MGSESGRRVGHGLTQGALTVTRERSILTHQQKEEHSHSPQTEEHPHSSAPSARPKGESIDQVEASGIWEQGGGWGLVRGKKPLFQFERISLDVTTG